MNASHLLVTWESVLMLLNVCRVSGCGSDVLPDNITATVEGTNTVIRKTRTLVALNCPFLVRVLKLCIRLFTVLARACV